MAATSSRQVQVNVCMLRVLQPSTVRGQHLPLVDRFMAELAATSSPVKRTKAPGKLLDVERMFHEVGTHIVPHAWYNCPLAKCATLLGLNLTKSTYFTVQDPALLLLCHNF